MASNRKEGQKAVLKLFSLSEMEESRRRLAGIVASLQAALGDLTRRGSHGYKLWRKNTVSELNTTLHSLRICNAELKKRRRRAVMEKLALSGRLEDGQNDPWELLSAAHALLSALKEEGCEDGEPYFDPMEESIYNLIGNKLEERALGRDA